MVKKLLAGMVEYGRDGLLHQFIELILEGSCFIVLKCVSINYVLHFIRLTFKTGKA